MDGRRILACLVLWLWSAFAPAPAEAAAVLTYLAHAPAQNTAHPPLIVVLHGSGADERDMIGLWPQLPSAVVVSPRGPFQDASGGYRWYRKAGASGGVEADLDLSRKSLDLLIDDALKRFDADPNEVFLVGFSQGAVMAYDIALKEPGRFRGAAILSGSLFHTGALQPSSARAKDAFFIGHGSADERIPFAAATAAQAALARLGAPVEFHAYPGMHHEIGETETKDLGLWLAGRIAASPGARSP